MSDSRNIIEKAVERVRKDGITIKYDDRGERFHMTISSLIGDGQRNYIFNYVPYTDLDGIDEDTLVDKIHQYANHKVAIFAKT